MKKYTNYELCKQCGGKCCKQNGCIYMPKDFSTMDFKYLKKLLEEGKISISGQPFNGFLNDAWSFLLYLRARNIDADIVDLITAGGPCIMLSDTGCLLKETKRPTLGLLVQPTVAGGPCTQKYTSNYLLKWLEYNKVLEELVKYYTNKDVDKVIVEQLSDRLKIIEKKIDSSQELKSMEKKLLEWRKDIILNKPYYTLDEVKQLILY